MAAPRINLAHNSRPFSATGWSPFTGTSIAHQPAGVGPGGLLGTMRATNTSGTLDIDVQYAALSSGKAGVPTTSSAWVKAPAAANVRAQIRFEDSTGGMIGGYVAAYTQVPANVWTKVSVTGASTVDYARRALSIGVPNVPTAGSADVAHVMFGATGNYFDGDFADAGGASYWWNGIPYASPSTEARAITATPNLESASVYLEVFVDPSLAPTTIFDIAGRDITQGYHPGQKNDFVNWTGWSAKEELAGTTMRFRTTAATGTVLRPLTGFIVGRTYRVQLTAGRGPDPVLFGVAGSTVYMPQGSGIWLHTHTFVATATSHSISIGTTNTYTPPIENVAVALLPVGYVADSAFSLTRTDANGTRPVRLLAGQSVDDGQLTVEDTEAAMTGPITYSMTVNGQGAGSVTTTLDGSTGYRVAPVVFPQFGTTFELVTGYRGDRDSSTFAHVVIGRPDPVVRVGRLTLRRGQLTVWCATYADVLAGLAVYGRGEVVLLRQPELPGFDLYHVALGASEGPYEEGRWRLDIEYVECAWPSGPLLGSASWTWDALVATFATWNDVIAFFATWNEVQIGPTT